MKQVFAHLTIVQVTLGTWNFSSKLYLGFCVHAHILSKQKKKNPHRSADTLQEGAQEKVII